MDIYDVKKADALLLVEEAKNATLWQKKYGRKTLAEVLSEFLGVESLIKDCNIDQDVAVELKGRSDNIMLGTYGKAIYRMTKSNRHKDYIEKNSIKKRMQVVLNKKNGEVQTLIQRGDKMVVVGGKNKKSEKPTTSFIKSKNVAVSKIKEVVINLPNNKKLKKVFCGDVLVKQTLI